MKIRKANVSDLRGIDEIYVEGSIDEGKYQFPNISLKEMKKDLDKKQNSRRQGFRRYMKSKKHYWIVAEEKGKIIGFGQVWIKNKDTGITESVYVDRKYRKRGVGKDLMKEMIKWLKNKKLKYIESSAYLRNKPSVKLHEKLGFKPFLVRMRLK
jgi:L-amino acid N-acyltransferase YncA